MSKADLSCCVALVTYGRGKVLAECLAHLSRQTRQPDEIIVVDASPDADETRRRVEERLPELAHRPGYRFLTSERGMTLQRNVAVDHTTSDVTIFLDDDAMATPDYVATIMRVYEADTDRQLGAVQGRAIEGDEGRRYWAEHCAEPTDNGSRQPASGGVLASAKAKAKRKVAVLRRKGFLSYVGASFPPDQVQTVRPVPAGLASLNLTPIRTTYGCVMSFRTDLARSYRFNELFRNYSFLEDVEISYRVGKEHAIVRCDDAVAYHVQATTGRVNGYRLTYGYLLNAAYIARTCMDWTPQTHRHMLNHHTRYARWHTLCVPIQGEGINRCRGARAGLAASRILFDLSDEEIPAFMENPPGMRD